jgi:hypothetical protein
MGVDAANGALYPLNYRECVNFVFGSQRDESRIDQRADFARHFD